jgi:hypothetical protein
MRIHFVLFLSMLFSWALPALAKYKVCTITINSTHERKVFEKRLNKNDFEFIELTDFSSNKMKRENDWFTRACEAQVQCDVLVVSGHFGGSFFGSSKYTLGLKELGSASCQRSCPGILNHPKETYLFGCNTLATKDKDHRDEATYLQVLLNDHIDRAEAERRVAARYGPFGSSFKDQIERSFEGVPVIYGFKSVGPSGENVKAALEKYLTMTGDFKRHLDQVQRGRPNPIWSKTMAQFNWAVGEGLSPQDKAYDIRQNICIFNDSSKSIGARVEHAVNILTQDPLTYLPSVSEFVNREVGNDSSHRVDVSERQATQAVFSVIRQRTDLAARVAEMANSNTIMPSIKVDLLKMSRNLGWLDASEFDRRVRGMFEPWLKDLSRSNVDLICSILNEDQTLRRLITNKDLKRLQFSRSEDFALVGCTNRPSEAVTERMLEGYERYGTSWSGEQDLGSALAALLSGRGHEERILRATTHLKNYRGPMAEDVRKFVSVYLALAKTRGQSQLDLIKNNAKDIPLTYYMLSKNDHIEPASLLYILQAVDGLPAEESIFSDGELPLENQEAFESLLLQNWNRLSLRSRLTSATMFLGAPRIYLSDLRLKILELLRSNQDSLSMFAAPLGKSELRPEEIKLIHENLDNLSSKTSVGREYFESFYMHILYQQAIKGRIPMTEELQNVRKTTYECRVVNDGSECTTQSY